MNIIRTSFATTTAIVLSLGLALPVSAKGLDASVNSAAQGVVTAGDASLNTNLNVGVDVGAGTNSSSTSSGGNTEDSSSADANATMEANTTVAAQVLVITRADVDGGSVQATVSSPSSVTTQAELSGYVASEMKADSNISSVESASDNVALTYKQHAKLFGFIPVSVDATATVDASGKVVVSYPWYAFLMTTNKSDLETRIQSRVDADASLTASANAGADASMTTETVGELSAAAQARIVAAVKAAMQAELNASINASANGDVSVR